MQTQQVQFKCGLRETVTFYVVYGFRHSFRDRLGLLNVHRNYRPIRWVSLKSVGQGYGNGYEIRILLKYIKMI